VGRSLSDAVMSWLRLQTHLESTPHPCHMYTKCFSTLIRCGWAYGCTLTLYPSYLAHILWCCVTCGVNMMWLCHDWGWQPPQTDSHIRNNTKCLSTLICYPLAYSSSLTQYYAH
jgi:hypothetical protein